MVRKWVKKKKKLEQTLHQKEHKDNKQEHEKVFNIIGY